MKANFHADFGGLAEAIGTVIGLGEGLDDDDYLGSLIDDAHNAAAKDFDLAAASAAGAGYLTHVYEFGTAGITRGPVRFPDPTSLGARLWTHSLTGRGTQRNISFAFRPALAPNPQPRTSTTGVPSKYLRRLSRRKYIFRNKAAVMESGTQVEIRPKNGNLIFVPFYGEASDNPDNHRGYMMYPFSGRPLTITPGRTSAGTFTAFWNAWWSGVGERSMSNKIGNNLNADVAHAIATSSKRATGRTSMNMMDFIADVHKAQRITEQTFKTKATRRRRETK